jgi:hypothetical protein
MIDLLLQCLRRSRAGGDFALRLRAAVVADRFGGHRYPAVIRSHRRRQMAITQTLNAKYPHWIQEDWDRFRWINSGNRRRRNLAPLLP